MSVWARIRNCMSGGKRRRVRRKGAGLLREFVYLDEVSVHSLLASRKGGIAAEFTESQEASQSNDIGGSLGVGFGATGAKRESKLQSRRAHSSQVLSKAIVQTSFKELYEMEQDHLALSSRGTECLPTARSAADLMGRLERSEKDSWVVDPATIYRGELLEVEVELETDPIFRLASIATILRELVQDSGSVFGNTISVQQQQEMRSITEILERLLVGLVPIRGSLVDYKYGEIDGRGVLIHRLLVEKMPPDTLHRVLPVIVVGVAERELFWKDIRRVLFSRGKYTIFCRVGKVGLSDRWHAVKVADVFTGIVPDFDEQVRKFSEVVRRAMSLGSDAAPTLGSGTGHRGGDVIRAYAQRLVKHHGGTMKCEEIDDVIERVSPGNGWLNSVDESRPVFAEVTDFIDNSLGVETPREVASDSRRSVVRSAEAAGVRIGQEASGSGDDVTSGSSDEERYLEAEIIAIYW